MRSILAIGLVAACGGAKGDECEQFMAKMLPVAMKEDKKPPDEAQQAKVLADCRTARKDGKLKDNPMFDCVLKADGEAAVKACMAPQFDEYMKKSKRVEAQLQLNKLGKSAKIEFQTTSQFPQGKARALPAGPCCGQPNNKCAPVTTWAADPVWQVLDFQIAEPTLFTYSYESTSPTSFVATAVGDLDCDGTLVTYKAIGSAPEGTPIITFEEPPPNAD